MDFFEAVEKRYTYRGAFSEQEIPEADLRKILDSAIRAPSGLNRQTTGFVAVTDPELRSRLGAVFPHKGIATAPVIVVVFTEYAEVYQGTAFELQDYSAAVENILLAVTALGYATVWTDGETHAPGRQNAIAELLNIPQGKTVRCVLPIGIPLSPGRQMGKKHFEKRVHFNKFS